MFENLGRLGFVEGRNLAVASSGFGLRTEQFPETAAEFAKDRVDVILAGGDPAIRAAQQATATIPILGFTDDMVGSGLVSSMARPGGNTSGISLLATELDGKRQELLIEMTADAHRIAALVDADTTAPERLQQLQEAAEARGIEVALHRVTKPEEIAGAMEAAKAAGAAGLNVLASPLLFAERQRIMERAAALRLPAIYQWPEIAEQGGLSAYGPRIVQLFGEVMSAQLAKLLRGTKPADLPVQQPTKLEFVINLKTANAMGFTVPKALVNQADNVIE
jgi:putative ABC transport system substrate-binding protein